MRKRIKSGDLVRFDFSEISNEIAYKYLAPIVLSDPGGETEWCEIDQGEIGIVVEIQQQIIALVLFTKKNKVARINTRRLHLIRHDPSAEEET
jgi:hypothetical protein